MNLERIKATLTSAQENMSIHVGCGGECDNNNYCYGCNKRVSLLDIAKPSDATDSYVKDVAILLGMIDDLHEIMYNYSLESHKTPAKALEHCAHTACIQAMKLGKLERLCKEIFPPEP